VTEATSEAAGSQASYDLTFDLDGSSFAVRENLADVLKRELLGPIHGPDELLPFSPRSQYLVGHIAPVKLTGSKLSAFGDGDTGRDLIEVRTDDGGISEGRGVPAYAADETEADSDDDDAEDRAPKQGLMIPASMGLRFQVPADQESFDVTASWGIYESVETEKVSKAGRPIRHYQRVPVEERRTVHLADLVPGKTVSIALRNDACLRMDRYDDPQFGRVLVEIALCNDRETPMPIPLSMWMFQTKLLVDAGGAEAFLPVRDVLEQDWPEYDEEVKRLNLQYRNRLEFAIGRTCSVDWTVKEGARRATSVETTWLPIGETPQTRAQSVKGALLSMDELSKVTPADLRAGLEPLVTGYGAWLDEQETQAAKLPAHWQETCELVLWEARQAHARLVSGLKHVATDPEALRCFQFMNRVMRDQRIASQVAAERASDASVTLDQAQVKVTKRGPGAASWRPFQLAFILMQLGALTDPTAPLRSAEHQSRVELLFFPTGGGKTEAYLGLAAYTFAIRRRQGVVESAEGSLDGNDGIAVLMRYTLRLLTAQQFQRATTLMCAAELGSARGRGDLGSGAVPHRAVGRNRREPQALRRGRRAAEEGERVRLAPADRAPDPALPVVRHPDHCRAGQGRRHDASCVRSLWRRARPVPVLQGRRGLRRACRSSPSTRRSTA
jgi:hypothetical protein